MLRASAIVHTLCKDLEDLLFAALSSVESYSGIDLQEAESKSRDTFSTPNRHSAPLSPVWGSVARVVTVVREMHHPRPIL